jgi:predicted nucleotidyltransferase
MLNKIEDFQNLLNKKLNKFFDTKYIYLKKNDVNIEELIDDYQRLKKTSINKRYKRISLKLTKFDKKKYLKNDHSYRKKIVKIYDFLKKKQVRKYFNVFLIHGSLATKDYIKGWSDVDTFVVIKDNILLSQKKLLELKKILKELYKIFFSITKLQHHGLIMFTEFDLKNYQSSYLPFQAFKKNLNLLNNNKIIFNIEVKPNKKIYSDLIERYKLLVQANSKGEYKHHPRNNKFLSVPLKAGKKEMYQLFCHLGFVNTLPAYYFSAIGKNCSKKDSFKLFYKTQIGKKLKNFLKKSEEVRKTWSQNQKKIFTIPTWVIEKIGKDYMNQSQKNFKILINEIKKKNKY